jgi:hypothetical protein
MATARVIRGVLGNFLCTYTSRYSNYDGYWLFGFLVAELGELRIDLLAPADRELSSPLSVAIRTAATKFEDQVRKAGLVPGQVREAWLILRRMPGLVDGLVNDHPCSGYNIRFLAGALMDSGRQYGRERVIFVAPHNASVERRSGRFDDPCNLV